MRMCVYTRYIMLYKVHAEQGVPRGFVRSYIILYLVRLIKTVMFLLLDSRLCE